MAIKSISIILLALLLTGCAALQPGRIYSNTTEPHSTDFNNTSVGSKRCVLNEHSVKEPISGHGVTVSWSTDVITSVAKEAGIDNISFTELQTLSIMMGTYKRRRLIIYGD